VEDPLASLFLWFDKAEGAEIEEIAFDEVYLGLGHSATLQIHGKTRQVRRSGFAFSWSCIPIVAAELLLNLYSANGRVDLDLVVELPIVGLAKIFHEIAGPRAAKAPIGIKPRIDSKRLASTDRDESFTLDQSMQLIVILNAWEVEPINFFILKKKRFVGRPEHRVPTQLAYVATALEGAAGCRPFGRIAVQSERRTGYGQNKNRYPQTATLFAHKSSNRGSAAYSRSSGDILSHGERKPSENCS
jgi:hypothetical protein